MLEFLCPRCRRYLQSPEENIGKRAKCNYCESIFSIPSYNYAEAEEHMNETPPLYGNPYFYRKHNP